MMAEFSRKPEILREKEISKIPAEHPALSPETKNLFAKERAKIAWPVYNEINQFVQNSILPGLALSKKRLLTKDTEGVARIFEGLERSISQNVKQIRKHISKLKCADRTPSMLLKLPSKQIKMVIKKHRLKEKIKKLLIEERDRVAQHLHDEVLQNLATIAVGIQLCEKLLNSDQSRVLKEIGELETLTCQIVCGLDKFPSKPSAKDAGGKKLIPFLEGYLSTFQGISDGKVSLTVFGRETMLSPETAENLFLIIKEALVNAIKHAEASKIDVHLNFKSQRVFVAVADDGKGFSLQAEKARTTQEHLGLREMRRRAESLRGILAIKTMLGCGTEISVSVPTRFPQELQQGDECGKN